MRKNYVLLFFFFVVAVTFGQEKKLFKPINKAIIQKAVNDQLGEQFTETDKTSWFIDGESSSLNKNAWYYYIVQEINGIEVMNALTPVLVKNGSDVQILKSTFVEKLDSKVTASAASISANDALQKATNHLKLPFSSLQQLESNNNGKEVIFEKGTISQEDIKVKLYYYPVNEGEEVKLVWNVSVFMVDGLHWWNVRVDASNGQVIDKFDWTVNCSGSLEDGHSHGKVNRGVSPKVNAIADACIEEVNSFSIENSMATQKSYRVLRYDIESPNHGDFTLEVNPENLTASPLGWHSNGNAADFYQETRGNNVRAIDDSGNPQNSGPETLESSADVYDYPYGGPYVAADTYIDAAVTNLFYMSNAVHDIYYLYGFDEPSRNFQNNNFGNGGAGNDAIRADAQDGGGINNANFSTPPDGNDGVMQMYLWDIEPQQNLLTVNNSSAAGDYVALDNAFAPGNVPVTSAITANLVLVDDGTAPDNTDGCESVLNGAQVNGNIAVIRRGNCTFTSKVINAQNRNAVAVLIVNNVAGDISMGGGDAAITIPAYSINQADGEAIIAAMSGTTVSATFNAPQSGFVNIDGDFDNGVIAHEYGHGIHIRLSGGTSVSCSTGYAESLSEGWGDYIGKILQLSNVDNGIYLSGTGTFVVGQPTDGPGIRPSPYSGSIANNPMTYETLRADTGNATYTIPHGVGSVLAGMLWDLTWDMIAVHGFEPDIYNVSSNAGNVKTLKILVEALKNTPCFAGFEDTRDAILTADQTLFAGENQCVIWSAFARRGLGANANQGSTNSTSDGAHDYSMPNGLGCTPDYLLTIGGPTDTCEGTSLDFEIVFNAQNGWNSNVGFAVSGLPGGASATFSPTTISDTGLVTLTIDNLPAGAHNITVTPGGDNTKDLVLPINVQESNADLTDGDTLYQVDGSGYTSFSDGATIDVSTGSDLDLQLPDTAFVGTLLWTAPNGAMYTTNTVSFTNVADNDTAVEGVWKVEPTFELDCPGSTGTQVINFTVNVSADICFTPRVYLQGALLTSGGALMDDGIRVDGNIPTTSPYGDAVIAPASVFNVTGNDAIVDWVWVELREVGNNTNVLASTSALLQRDGDVVNYVDGTGTVKFGLPAGNYLMSINHRNHLGVMSGTLALDAACKVIDFSDGSIPIYGSNAQTTFGTPSGVSALWAGDSDGNNEVKFSGASNDSNPVRDGVVNDAGNIFGSISYTYSGYAMLDASLNGEVKFSGVSNDSNIIRDNVVNHPGNIFGSISYVILEQLP